ncbi:ArnT family glycosyltransferase [Hymenobacter coalescens]
MTLSKKQGLALIVFGAFVLRALFTVYGAPIYYGLPAPACYSFGDATSYMWAAENLIDHGRYTFDYLEPDATFGRLPGYPMFYGLHYLIFGPGTAIYATAWSQVILDSLAVLLVFGIVRRLAPASAAAPWIGAALYASYPFIIFWVPMVYTELLATDVTLLIFYALLRYSRSTAAALVLGLLVAVGLFVREYLGLFLPIAMLWVVWAHGGLRRAAAWRAAVLVGVGFGLLYIGWPVRNYLVSGRIIPLKPKTAGYASHKADLDDFRSWVHCWTNDENPWIEQVAKGTGPVPFPAKVFADAQEAARAQELVTMARRCGSSFYMQREATNSTIYGLEQEKAAAATGADANAPRLYTEQKSATRSIYTVYRDTAFMMHDPTYLFYRNHNCNEAISAGFQELKASYARRNPADYWLGVPGKNLFKAFFKSNTAGQIVGAKALAIRVLFAYRSLLVVLGVVGLVVFWRNRGLWPVAIYAGAMFLFICFVMRNLEMRYLLQADVLLLIPATLVLARLADPLLVRLGVRPRRAEPAPAV